MNAGDRLSQRFADLRRESRAGFVAFITAGDPNAATSLEIMRALPDAGVDIIELGMPFSDPMADGPAIQDANLRAIKAGMTLKKTLAMVRAFRERDANTPIILMGYYNPIHRYGVPAFVGDAVSAGVDGLIIVDLPPEEDDELCHPCRTAGLHWVRLSTPTCDDARLAVVLKNASGFIYHVAIAGITGTKSAEERALADAVKRIRRHTELPVAVGFGIKNPNQVRQTAQIADAVVVGSAIVDAIAEGAANQTPQKKLVARVAGLVAELAAAVK